MIQKWLSTWFVALLGIQCQPSQSSQPTLPELNQPAAETRGESVPPQKTEDATADDLLHVRELLGKSYAGAPPGMIYQQLSPLKGYENLGGGIISAIENQKAYGVNVFRKASTYIFTLEKTSIDTKPSHTILDAVQINNVSSLYQLSNAGFVHYQGQPDNSLIALYDPKQATENGQYVLMWKVIKADLETKKLKSFDQEGVSVPFIVP
ncbi:MAG: hypothetical protein HC913_07110 [Microscillaceae bacterium]|nr:hypothetical protein [Microscillaceae bacterium]